MWIVSIYFHSSDQRSCLDYISYVAQLARAGLQLGSDYIDVEGEIDCGDQLNTHMIRMHDLDFAMKTTQTESILLSSPFYELKNVGLR